jgi:hypothetical protein
VTEHEQLLLRNIVRLRERAELAEKREAEITEDRNLMLAAVGRLVDELAARDDEIARLRVARGASRALARCRLRVIERHRLRVEQAEASSARVEALHARVNTKDGKACDHCRGRDEEPSPWPCPTIAALAQSDAQEGTI